jgi:hypothetical protein
MFGVLECGLVEGVEVCANAETLLYVISSSQLVYELLCGFLFSAMEPG